MPPLPTTPEPPDPRNTMTSTDARAREVAAKTYYDLRWADDGWLAVPDVHREAYYEVVDVIFTALSDAGIRLAGEGETVWTVDYLGDGDWQGQSWCIGVFATEDEAFDAVRQVQRESRVCRKAQNFLVDQWEIGNVVVPLQPLTIADFPDRTRERQG